MLRPGPWNFRNSYSKIIIIIVAVVVTAFGFVPVSGYNGLMNLLRGAISFLRPLEASLPHSHSVCCLLDAQWVWR